MRLEGTLNQIRLRCPGQIADWEVPWHLKEWLFHGVWKHMRDSIRYLYGNSKTTYSELVVAAHEEQKAKWKKQKKESKQDQLLHYRGDLWLKRARGPNSQTDGCFDQGRARAVALQVLQIVPGTGVVGEGKWTGTPLSAPAPTMVRLAWVKLLLFAVPPLTTREVLTFREGEICRCTDGTQGGAQSTRDSNTLQCFRCQGWGHMARECATLAKMLNKEGGTQGNTVKPPSNNTQ